MKKNEIPPMMDVCPLIAVSKFTHLMHDFDTLVSNLLVSVCAVFYHFQWFGAGEKDKDEKESRLHLIGCLFLRILNHTKKVFETRGHVIRDEHCESVEEIIKDIDNHMGNIFNFIDEAEVFFSSNKKYQSSDKWHSFFKDSKEYMHWMQQIAKDERLMNQIIKKCRDMNLHHGFGMFGLEINEFRQLTFTVLNALFLLTVPSQIYATDEHFAELYQNSLNTYQKSSYWQSIQKQLEEQVKTKYEEDKEPYSVKMALVKKGTVDASKGKN